MIRRNRCPTVLPLALCALVGISSAVAAQSAAPGSERSQPRWPSQSLPERPVEVRICSCRYAGQNIPIGKTICMRYEGQSVRATCDTVANNPSWSISTEICPSS